MCLRNIWYMFRLGAVRFRTHNRLGNGENRMSYKIGNEDTFATAPVNMILNFIQIKWSLYMNIFTLTS